MLSNSLERRAIMIISNLDMKIDERAYSYVQQILNGLNFNSNEVSLSKEQLEEVLFNSYKKGFQTGVDIITDAVKSVNHNIKFVKKS